MRPGESPQSRIAGPGVTFRWLEEESEGRFEVDGAYATVTDQGARVWLLGLWVPPGRRGRGHARALLEAVIARFAGRVLCLSAEPFEVDDDEPAGLDAAALAAWYTRHGFQPGGDLMVRFPVTGPGMPRQ